MNRTLIIRLGLIGLFFGLARLGWQKVQDDVGMSFVYFIALGVIIGLLVVKYGVTWFGEAVGTAVYSSGEMIRVNDGVKAAAKLAQGDYEGAIAEHEKSLQEDPAQSFPIAEIAKICVEKLQDPQRALSVLQQQLKAQTWPDEDAVFLRFRIIEIQMDTLKDYSAARALLESVMADFPGTRHAANAHHKLHELEQLEFKLITEQRLKAASQSVN